VIQKYVAVLSFFEFNSVLGLHCGEFFPFFQVKKFPKNNNPRRHVFVQARVIIIVNSGPKKADGVKLV
jgi:hypothetical protein